MNEELQNNLADVLKGIADGVAQSKDFVVEQLPDVAQQYIMFGRLWEPLNFLFGAVLTVVAVRCIVFSLKKAKEDHYDDLPWFLAAMLGGFLSVLFAIASFDSLKDAVMAWFAPKLYLLQGVAELVK